MARQELHSSTMPIEQMPPIADPSTYEGDIITGEKIGSVDGGYLADLAMMEEPVTIRLEPSSERNAASTHPFWCNGKMAEVWQHGRWEEIGYLPFGRVLTVKRKTVEQIIRAKITTFQTKILDDDSDRPRNIVDPVTSAVISFSIIEDRNPHGAQWVTELRRRNY